MLNVRPMSLAMGLLLGTAAIGSPGGAAAQFDPAASVSNDGSSVPPPQDLPPFVAAQTGVADLGPRGDAPPANRLWGLDEKRVLAGLTRTSPSLPLLFDIRSIIGNDDRQPVKDTAIHPYRAIVLILADVSPDEVPTLRGCSGWLYGEDVVATAGHCLHSGGDQPTSYWFKNFVVIPGSDRTRAPFGTCSARRVYSVKGWVEKGLEEYDYGAIKLDCKIGARTGTIGLLGSGLRLGASTVVGGYSSNFPVTSPDHPERDPTFRQQWTAPDAVRHLTDRLVFYENDTGCGGGSGAPVYGSTSDCGQCAIGVHTMGRHVLGNGLCQEETMGTGPHQRYNHGLRVSDVTSTYINFVSWMKAP